MNYVSMKQRPGPGGDRFVEGSEGRAERPLGWPRSFADLRGLSTVSRRMVLADRLMGRSPDYMGVLQRTSISTTFPGGRILERPSPELWGSSGHEVVADK